MKALKSAIQKNVTVDYSYYTIGCLNKMFIVHTIFRFDSEYNVDYKQINGYSDLYENEARLDLDDVDELKVVYNKELGYYETVAVLKDKKIIHVNL